MAHSDVKAQVIGDREVKISVEGFGDFRRSLVVGKAEDMEGLRVAVGEGGDKVVAAYAEELPRHDDSAFSLTGTRVRDGKMYLPDPNGWRDVDYARATEEMWSALRLHVPEDVQETWDAVVDSQSSQAAQAARLVREAAGDAGETPLRRYVVEGDGEMSGPTEDGDVARLKVKGHAVRGSFVDVAKALDIGVTEDASAGFKTDMKRAGYPVGGKCLAERDLSVDWEPFDRDEAALFHAVTRALDECGAPLFREVDLGVDQSEVGGRGGYVVPPEGALNALLEGKASLEEVRDEATGMLARHNAIAEGKGMRVRVFACELGTSPTGGLAVGHFEPVPSRCRDVASAAAHVARDRAMVEELAGGGVHDARLESLRRFASDRNNEPGQRVAAVTLVLDAGRALRRGDMSGRVAAKADLSDIDLGGLDFSGLDLSRTGADFSGASLAGSQWHGAKVSDVSFSGANLRNAMMDEAEFGGGVDMSRADLTYASLPEGFREGAEVSMEGADLTHATENGRELDPGQRFDF